MATRISQSAPVESIALYLKRMHGYDLSQAREEARQVVDDFQKMERMGYIKGWYFDEQGHLDVIPTEDVLGRLNEK